MKVIGFKIEHLGTKDLLKDVDVFEKRIDGLFSKVEKLSKIGSKPSNSPKTPSKDETKTRSQIISQLNKELQLLDEGDEKREELVKEVARLRNEQKKLNDEIREQQKIQSGRGNTLADLQRELKLTKGGTDERERLIVVIARLKNEQKQLTDRVKEQQREFQSLGNATGSYRELESTLIKLKRRYKELSAAERESLDGRRLTRQIQVIDAQLKQLDANIGQYFRNVGNYESAFRGLQSVAARFTAILGVTTGLEEIVQNNAKISESVADVGKTTGATKEEVEALAETLKFRDTRTTLADQLKIGEIGGRLGEAQKDLGDFIGAVDKINVALGDQFDNVDQVTTVLAGLRNSLTDIKSENTSDDLLKIGNALNFLESRGNATAATIADFVNRISGGARSLDVTSAQIFGISTTLDELNVSAERGGTAVVKLLTNVASAPDKFAAIAGYSDDVNGFNELVQNDLSEAFALIVKGAQEGTGANTEFAALLNDLGIGGSGAIEVFAKLGGSYDRLKENIEASAEALSNSNSIQEEFDRKNNTLAASIDKFKNTLINLTVDAGLQDFLKTGVDGLSSFAVQLAKLPSFIKDNKEQLILLGVAIASFQFAAAIGQIKQIRNAYIAWSAATQGQTIAQKLLNTAMRANPIGLVVTAIALLVGGLITLYKNSEIVRNGVNALTNKFLEFYENNLLVRAVLFNIVEPLKLVYNLITDFPGTIDKFVAAAKVLRVRIRENFVQMGLQAELLAQKLNLAFSIKESTKKAIRADIKAIEGEIEASNKRIENEGKKQEEIRRQRAIGRSIAQEKKEIEEKRKLNEIASKEEIERREKAAAKLNELKEKEVESEKRAQEEIKKLRAEAINNDFDRQIEQQKNETDKQLGDLENVVEKRIDNLKKIYKGDELKERTDVVKNELLQQTKLINEALAKQVDEIEKRRKEANEKALRRLNSFTNEVEKTRNNRNISSLENDLQGAETEQQVNRNAIGIQAQKELSELKTLLAQKEITENEFNQKTSLARIEHKEQLLSIDKSAAEREIEIIEELTKARLQAIEIEKSEQLQGVENDSSDRLKELNQLLNDELITREQFNQQIEQLEQGKAEKIKSIDEGAEDEKERVLTSSANDRLAILQDIAQKEIEIIDDKNAQIIEKEKLTQSNIKELRDGLFDGLQDTFGALETLGDARLNRETAALENRYNREIELASGNATRQQELAEELDRRKETLERQAFERRKQLEIAGALTSYFQGIINIATNKSTIPDPFGQMYKGMQIAALTGVTFANIANIRSQQLAEGGSIPYGDGTILGQSHSQRGVKEGNYEYEGGEWKMRNGHEKYIINRKSTRKFKPLLASMKGSNSIYDPMKRVVASNINSFNGWGKKFQDGGAISPLDLNPLVPSAQITNLVQSDNSDAINRIEQQNKILRDNLQAVQNMTVAVNDRIDRIEVVNDAESTLDAALSQKEFRQVNNL